MSYFFQTFEQYFQSNCYINAIEYFEPAQAKNMPHFFQTFDQYFQSNCYRNAIEYFGPNNTKKNTITIKNDTKKIIIVINVSVAAQAAPTPPAHGSNKSLPAAPTPAPPSKKITLKQSAPTSDNLSYSQRIIYHRLLQQEMTVDEYYKEYKTRAAHKRKHPYKEILTLFSIIGQIRNDIKPLIGLNSETTRMYKKACSLFNEIKPVHKATLRQKREDDAKEAEKREAAEIAAKAKTAKARKITITPAQVQKKRLTNADLSILTGKERSISCRCTRFNKSAARRYAQKVMSNGTIMHNYRVDLIGLSIILDKINDFTAFLNKFSYDVDEDGVAIIKPFLDRAYSLRSTISGIYSTSEEAAANFKRQVNVATVSTKKKTSVECELKKILSTAKVNLSLEELKLKKEYSRIEHIKFIKSVNRGLVLGVDGDVFLLHFPLYDESVNTIEYKPCDEKESRPLSKFDSIEQNPIDIRVAFYEIRPTVSELQENIEIARKAYEVADENYARQLGASNHDAWRAKKLVDNDKRISVAPNRINTPYCSGLNLALALRHYIHMANGVYEPYGGDAYYHVEKYFKEPNNTHVPKPHGHFVNTVLALETKFEDDLSKNKPVNGDPCTYGDISEREFLEKFTKTGLYKREFLDKGLEIVDACSMLFNVKFNAINISIRSSPDFFVISGEKIVGFIEYKARMNAPKLYDNIYTADIMQASLYTRIFPGARSWLIQNYSTKKYKINEVTGPAYNIINNMERMISNMFNNIQEFGKMMPYPNYKYVRDTLQAYVIRDSMIRF